MGQLLIEHMAGQRVAISKNELFRRMTDEYVRLNIGKNPLEVGADRIARAAHHALEILSRLREASGKAIPLAWSHDVTGVVAIEVYPAATLVAHGYEFKGYKASEGGLQVRGRLAKDLKSKVRGIRGSGAVASDHEFDACLCLLAARDFLENEADPPIDFQRAKREGWIWVRRRGPRGV